MLKDLIKKNRSTRGYDRSRKVTEDELKEMVDCARLSASSINKQPLRFYISNDENEVEIINSHVKMGGLLPELHLPLKGTEPVAYILICQDTKISFSKEGFTKDVGICAQSITLAAAEMGLNACMIGNFIQKRLRDAIGLDERYEIKLVIAIGKGIEKFEIDEVSENQSTNYYRDQNRVHHVPKVRLDDVVISRNKQNH